MRIFVIEDDTSTRLQANIPKKDILEKLHEGVASGHLGEEKTMSELKERLYWPGQWNDVRDWCRTCAVSLASVSRMNSLKQSGKASIGAETSL